MFKKILLTLVILMPVLGLWFAIFGNQIGQPERATEHRSIYPSRTPGNVPQTKLRFIPTQPKVNSDGIIEAEVFLDAFENRVSAVHLEIAYDPTVFSVVSVKGEDFLAKKKATINSIDREEGKITYAVTLDPSDTTPIKGSDVIAAIELRPLKKSVKQTELKFLPSTTISAFDVSGNAIVETENMSIDLTAL